MAEVRIEGLSKYYGEFRAADGVDLDIENGEFLVLLGPSGCGKTTTLRMIAGFVEPTSGRIAIGGSDVTWLPPWKRSTGLVFQNYALFPHLTVAQNVAFGLEMRKVPKSEIPARVKRALEMVRLEKLADRFPRQMSGGQQQRVALARALVFQPDVLLLDEPLSNLDAKLRLEVRNEIRALQQDLGITTVMVTHDQEEALTMADRMVVMSEGRVQQIGTQRELYDRPASRFVASFVGRSSFLEGRVDADGFTTRGGLKVAASTSGKGDGVIALRPERIHVSPDGQTPTVNRFEGVIEHVTYLGGALDLQIRLNAQDVVTAQIVNRDAAGDMRKGDHVHLGWGTDAPVFAD